MFQMVAKWRSFKEPIFVLPTRKKAASFLESWKGSSSPFRHGTMEQELQVTLSKNHGSHIFVKPLYPKTTELEV